ncbi:hypothetical protein QYE76_004717 [Lolium multiflorum]|uniref:Uncharacterized protein n=1 Tax=Lolium multiflorum TaxID=4521 RepID=A0AAD8RTP6_LOLMU|nr:hypothetical protein QYE76_004717 [Lolium multiflorum]
MKRFIVELGVVPSALDPLVIYCDNMGAIANAQEPRSHKRLKHIKLRYHSIREYIEDGEVKICKVHTDLNVADPLTKALPRAKHDQHQNAMGVRYLTMRLGATDFNCLVTHAENISNTFPNVGTTVNVHSFRAKHSGAGMHLRSLALVEISAACLRRPRLSRGLLEVPLCPSLWGGYKTS